MSLALACLELSSPWRFEEQSSSLCVCVCARLFYIVNKTWPVQRLVRDPALCFCILHVFYDDSRPRTVAGYAGGPGWLVAGYEAVFILSSSLILNCPSSLVASFAHNVDCWCCFCSDPEIFSYKETKAPSWIGQIEFLPQWRALQ